MMKRALLAAAFAASLAGCVSVLPEPTIPSALIALPAERAKAPDVQLQADVSVLPPDATRAFAGVDIAVASGQELVFLPDVRWADAAPRLMQGAVVDALSKAGGPGHVMTVQQGVRTDYELRWRIVDFSVGRGTNPVSVVVTASLADSETRRLIAQETFRATGTPESAEPRARAATLAAAAQDAADQVAAFAARHAVAVDPADRDGRRPR
jgi:cholesterol transport system auxiliary component